MRDSTITNRCWPADSQTPDKDRLKLLSEKLTPVLQSLLSEEKIDLDESYSDVLENLYLPFCAWLVSQHKNQPLIIGINGSQGSGKSTLSKILYHLLESGFNKKTLVISIDDLYRSKQEREALAKTTHPLLKTRGVPGTHDVALALRIFNHLKQKNPAELSIPVFDKSTDDLAPPSRWSKISGIYDIILFEGWCVGVTQQEPEALLSAVNQLEKDEDPDSVWRKYVNQQLESGYKDLFSLIDIQLFLKIPDFNKVTQWRTLQEEKLIASTMNSAIDNRTMSHSDIDRFIMHYERLTRHCLQVMPALSDIVFDIGDDHQIQNVILQVKK